MSVPSIQLARRLILQWACTALLAACAGPPRRPDDAGSPRYHRQEESPYQDTHPYQTEHFRGTWVTQEETLTLEWLLPRNAGPAPLVIYLPGLGETAQAGLAWRRAWAGSGHAVVSFQAHDDAAIWSSPAARRGEFAAIANERFGAMALSTRIQRTRAVIDSIGQRAREASVPRERIDTLRIALAGFNLGAQTVLSFCGEGRDGLTSEAQAALAPGMLRAAIAFAPPALAAAGQPDARFDKLHTPLLLVTTRNSDDPLKAARSRLAALPFDALPAGEKYLLTLEHGTHETLSGNEERQEDSQRQPRSGSNVGSNSSGAGETMQGRPRGGGGGLGDRPLGGGRSNPPGAGAERDRLSMESRNRTLVVQLSAAFLDAQLRDQERARSWLSREAEDWIGNAGELRRK